MDQQSISIGVLGPVVAWSGDGARVDLRGPRHREVLARLVVAHGRVVPVSTLVDDLGVSVGAVRTFVGALRQALEPGRAPRTPPRLLVTEGPGYALRTDAVDAWRFEDALDDPEAALRWWRGPAYADFADALWVRGERARLTELRLRAVERLAETRLARGKPAEAIPDLDAHVAEHPWREDAWGLLALALYRTGRQADALAVLRRARGMLVEELGLDPGPALQRLETDILNHADHLGVVDDMWPRPAAGRPGEGGAPSGAGRPGGGGAPSGAGRPGGDGGPSGAGRPGGGGAPSGAGRPGGDGGPSGAGRPGGADAVWSRAAADYDRTVAVGARARLESTVGLLRDLAVTGGLEAARGHRAAAVAAAEELGDPELTARVIGAYDVPAIWTRVDDPAQAAGIVAAAERTLTALGPDAHAAARARLLATIALESRGTHMLRGREAAAEAEAIARRLDDPTLLAFALNAVFMQRFERAGLAAERDTIGAELVDLSAKHDLANFAVLGHLIRLQSSCALNDLDAADSHAAAADDLAAAHERPLVALLTGLYRAMRLGTEAAYREAVARLDGSGMPGLQRGLLGLALLSIGAPATREDFGPYEPWVRNDPRARRAIPDPPHDLLQEALWCLTARAARRDGDEQTLARAREALRPAAHEHAAGSGIVTLGPVARYLD